MNIAMSAYYLPPQDRIGAGYMQHYLANAYVSNGHHVTLFSPASQKAEDAMYELATIPCPGKNRFFKFAWKLRDQDLSSYDVLHTGSEGFFLPGKKRPYHISTYHGACLAESLHARQWKDKLRMLVMAIAETSQCFSSNRNVCVSRNTCRYIPFAREVIWNGVDRTQFQPYKQKTPYPSILFIGTLQSRKRGDLLLKAFQEEIKPRIPEAELWIAREENPVVAEGVRWFGRVSLEKLVELYQNAWVFCLPSSYEGFGVPYIEAMACGTPVVSTPNPGASEVLDNGKYGRIVAPSQLGQGLYELLGNEADRKKYSALGLERAKVFDWNDIVKRYLSSVPLNR